MLLGVTRNILFLSLFGLLSAFPASAQILHLELGAANGDASDGRSSSRFLVLADELESLVKQYGPAGTVYLNDLSQSGLKLAEKFVKKWLAQRRITEVRVETMQVNYIRYPDHLPDVKTMSLNNPPREVLPEGYALAQHNIVRSLDRLASKSETGLKIVSYMGGRIRILGSITEGELVDLKQTARMYSYANGDVPVDVPPKAYRLESPPAVRCGRVSAP